MYKIQLTLTDVPVYCITQRNQLSEEWTCVFEVKEERKNGTSLCGDYDEFA